MVIWTGNEYRWPDARRQTSVLGDRTDTLKGYALAMVQSFLELEKAAGLMTGDANNKRQAVRVYQLLETAVSTRSVDLEIARFEPGAYAGRIKRH